MKFLFKKISRILYWLTPIEFREKKKSRIQIKLEQNLAEETFITFKNDLKKSLLFDDDIKIREFAIKTSLSNDRNNDYFYLEFGVWKGRTANLFSKHVNKLFAFDSFEGLREDWVGTHHEKGFFNLNKKIPKLNSNVQPIVGWVEDTLGDFLKKYNPKVNFVHIDMDTYTSTKFVLEKLKPYLVKDAIILFDEYFNYIGWEEGEYKAFKEVFKENEFKYRAFSINGNPQCVVQIINS